MFCAGRLFSFRRRVLIEHNPHGPAIAATSALKQQPIATTVFFPGRSRLFWLELNRGLSLWFSFFLSSSHRFSLAWPTVMRTRMNPRYLQFTLKLQVKNIHCWILTLRIDVAHHIDIASWVDIRKCAVICRNLRDWHPHLNKRVLFERVTRESLSTATFPSLSSSPSLAPFCFPVGVHNSSCSLAGIRFDSCFLFSHRQQHPPSAENSGLSVLQLRIFP